MESSLKCSPQTYTVWQHKDRDGVTSLVFIL